MPAHDLYATTVTHVPFRWEELDDCTVPFTEIFVQLDRSKQQPVPPPALKARAVPSIREDVFKPSCTVGRAFQPLGILRQLDLCPWDQQRAASPQRAWPSNGLRCELYDFERDDKPPWQPAKWQHTGEAFPPHPGFLSERPPDEDIDDTPVIVRRGGIRENVTNRTADISPGHNDKQLYVEGFLSNRFQELQLALGSAKRPLSAPASAPQVRPSSARSASASGSTAHRNVGSRPVCRPSSARGGPSSRPGGAPSCCKAGIGTTTHADDEEPLRALSGISGRARRPNSARTCNGMNSARAICRPSSVRSTRRCQ